MAAGADGGGLTVTLVVLTGPIQPPTLACTEYIPLAKAVAIGMLGFCVEAVNEFGPDQE